MSAGGDIWRQRLWVWVPALVFFAANLVVLGVYRVAYADRTGTLAEDLRRQQEEEGKQARELVRLDGLRQRAEDNDRDIERLYDEHFSTRRQRLTEATAEVKALAEKASMQPRSLTYPEQEIQAYGLVKRSFVFSVEGSYLDLRKLINLLELSDSFLTLESMALTGGGSKGQELRIDLTLSTLFEKEPFTTRGAPKAGPKASRPAAGTAGRIAGGGGASAGPAGAAGSGGGGVRP